MDSSSSESESTPNEPFVESIKSKVWDTAKAAMRFLIFVQIVVLPAECLQLHPFTPMADQGSIRMRCQKKYSYNEFNNETGAFEIKTRKCQEWVNWHDFDGLLKMMGYSGGARSKLHARLRGVRK